MSSHLHNNSFSYRTTDYAFSFVGQKSTIKDQDFGSSDAKVEEVLTSEASVVIEKPHWSLHSNYSIDHIKAVVLSTILSQIKDLGGTYIWTPTFQKVHCIPETSLKLKM